MTNVTGFRSMIRGFIAMIAAPFAPLATTQAQAELTLCNRTSFRMEAAVGIEKRANVVTRGWYRLDPGQCRQVMDGPFDADMVYLYARTPPVYGAAPLPQSGDADYCIRNGDFEVPNARGCPSSQQAHFSAAKPSDSPKGPVVNLAEEADYDDAQARLAGIQRLLVISGLRRLPDRWGAGDKDTGGHCEIHQRSQIPARYKVRREFLRRADRSRAQPRLVSASPGATTPTMR
jgi:uncharacterized membrane protein